MNESDAARPDQVVPVELPASAKNLLFVHWVHRLCSERFGLTGIQTTGPESRSMGIHSDYRFAGADDRSIRITIGEANNWILEVTGAIGRGEAEEVLTLAQQAVNNGDLGEGSCYIGALTSPAPDYLDMLLRNPQYQRLRQDQVLVEGAHQLGHGRIILDFTTEPPGKSAMFVPTTHITVTIFSPGPGPGPLSQWLANRMLETARITCAFALGRPVRGDAIGSAMAADDSEAATTQARRHEEIPGLARRGVYLDVGESLFQLGHFDAIAKARGSLLAYDAAMDQRNADIAALLMVSAMEALTVPSAEWRGEKVTRRFVRAAREMGDDALDRMMAMDDIGDTFEFKLEGSQSSRKNQLLSRIYELRSMNIHSGPSMMRTGLFENLLDQSAERLPLLSGLYQAMLLTYLQAPRSLLVGHPKIGPHSPHWGTRL